MNPALLLADEPTGNLDTVTADTVFAPLRKVNAEQGTTVLFVTHNPLLAERCDRTIDVVDGQTVVRLPGEASLPTTPPATQRS